MMSAQGLSSVGSPPRPAIMSLIKIKCSNSSLLAFIEQRFVKMRAHAFEREALVEFVQQSEAIHLENDADARERIIV